MKNSKQLEKFRRICNMEQLELKKYVENCLRSMGYTDIHKDNGFLYVKGDEPVLLLAHLDTVHKMLPEYIKVENQEGKTVLSSPFGIGGDDRCGVYMILDIVKNLKCSVLFTEDEEIGCVGATMFSKTKYINDLGVNYMIQFDRRGGNDAVFYNCDNKEFEDFVLSTGFFQTKQGSCSDISVVAPKAGIAAVNFSCGYYKEHRTEEYVVFEEMEKVIEEAKRLIQIKVDKPYEYIEKTYDWDDEWDYGYYNNMSSNGDYGWYREYAIVYSDNSGVEKIDFVSGYNEDDAILSFLVEHDTIPFKNILEIYSEDQLEMMGFYSESEMF